MRLTAAETRRTAISDIELHTTGATVRLGYPRVYASPDGETHNYVFTLYALTEATGVAEGAGGPEALQAITSTPGVAATLSATYAVPG